MIQHKKKLPDRNEAHCYTHASPNARCAKRTGTCQHAQEIPPKQVKWALLQADTPIHQTHTSTYQDLPRHSNEPSPSPLIVSPYPGSYLEQNL